VFTGLEEQIPICLYVCAILSYFNLMWKVLTILFKLPSVCITFLLADGQKDWGNLGVTFHGYERNSTYCHGNPDILRMQTGENDNPPLQIRRCLANEFYWPEESVAQRCPWQGLRCWESTRLKAVEYQESFPQEPWCGGTSLPTLAVGDPPGAPERLHSECWRGPRTLKQGPPSIRAHQTENKKTPKLNSSP
jgi:hypothetical protein